MILSIDVRSEVSTAIHMQRAKWHGITPRIRHCVRSVHAQVYGQGTQPYTFAFVSAVACSSTKMREVFPASIS